MKRIMALLAIVVFVALPASATAAVRESESGISCTEIWHFLGDPVPFVCLAQDIDYHGDKLTLTGSSDIVNLSNVTHSLPGVCGGLLGNSWNDCISSVWVKLGTGDSVCLYGDNGYHRLEWRAGRPPGPGTWTYSDSNLQVGSPPSDDVSSVMLQQSGNLCGEGGV